MFPSLHERRRFLINSGWAILAAAGAGLVDVSVPNIARAATPTYPTHPVRIIATYEPGGTNDIMARLAAEIWSQAYGVSVTVENRPGASGTLGTSLVAHAKPDGYTLLAGTFGPIITGQSLFRNLPYDPAKDFTGIGRLSSVPNVIVVHPDSPVKSLGEFIARAKASSRPLTFGVVPGGTPQFVIKRLEIATGISLLDIPYKSGTAALNDLLGNRLDLYADNVPALLPAINGKLLRPLALANEVRSPTLPQLSTTVELGFPDATISAWHGILAPAGTPREIVDALNHSLVAALHQAAIKKRIEDQGAIVVADSPQQFDAFIRSEIPRWAKVVQESGIKAS